MLRTEDDLIDLINNLNKLRKRILNEYSYLSGSNELLKKVEDQLLFLYLSLSSY